MRMTTIAIIGAGFCGTTLAVHLLRRPPVVPLTVILINRSGLMARGIAYGTRTEKHVLNVPAARMGATEDDPEEFLRFALRHDPRYTAGSFLPRRLYGDYLESLLADAASQAPAGVRFRAMVGEVDRIREGGGEKAELLLANGDCVTADKIVLALGNYVPADPAVPEHERGFFYSPRYIRDPWKPDALWGVRPEMPVLIIGTGLTMIDIVLDLRSRGHRGAITAVSRRGLIAQPHRELDTAPVYDPQLPQRLLTQPTALHYLREVRAAVRHAIAGGGDWRDVVGGLRAATPALWQALPAREHRRFLRHLRPHWDVLRHRCAPALWNALQGELEQGTLRLQAARLLGFEEQADRVRVRLRPRGTRQTLYVDAGMVINCTGPESNTLQTREPLVSALRADGLACPDALGLGLEVDERYALVNAAGHSSRHLHYIGPFLRARDWEATAIPELRQHVAQLAAHLRSELDTTRRTRQWQWAL